MRRKLASFKLEYTELVMFAKYSLEECDFKKSSIYKSLSTDVTAYGSNISVLSRAILLMAKFEQQD